MFKVFPYTFDHHRQPQKTSLMLFHFLEMKPWAYSKYYVKAIH